jgi:hypothetical protein
LRRPAGSGCPLTWTRLQAIRDLPAKGFSGPDRLHVGPAEEIKRKVEKDRPSPSLPRNVSLES